MLVLTDIADLLCKYVKNFYFSLEFHEEYDTINKQNLIKLKYLRKGVIIMSEYVKFEGKLDLILSKVGAIDEKVDKLEGRMDKMEDRMGKMESRMGKMEDRMGKMEDRMAGVEKEVVGLKSKVAVLDNKVAAMQKDVTNVKLRIENETSRNIRIIAENHLDLSRKLDEALRNSNEREIFMIRLNYLEGDVKRIKEKVFETA